MNFYDIHALNADLEGYINGEEPEDDAWLLDWAGAYKILPGGSNISVLCKPYVNKHQY